jgi:hypothetical protein
LGGRRVTGGTGGRNEIKTFFVFGGKKKKKVEKEPTKGSFISFTRPTLLEHGEEVLLDQALKALITGSSETRAFFYFFLFISKASHKPVKILLL